jgi:hypothetical protein
MCGGQAGAVASKSPFPRHQLYFPAALLHRRSSQVDDVDHPNRSSKSLRCHFAKFLDLN